MYQLLNTVAVEARADRFEGCRDLLWRANRLLKGIGRLVLTLLTAKAVTPVGGRRIKTELSC